MVRATFSFFAGVLVHRLWKRHALKIRPAPVVLAMALLAPLMAYPAAGHQAAFDVVLALLVFPAIVFLGASSVPGQ
jgi:hypothetical protein